MDDRGALAFAFPRPRRALIIVLVTIAAFGILNGFLVAWMHEGGSVLYDWLAADPEKVLQGQLWRLVTSGVLTEPKVAPVVFTLLGLYFLSPDLEKRWGGWRFVGVLAASIVAGNLLVFLFDALMPASYGRFHIPQVYGASAAIAATCVAWGRENPDLQVRFFFFLPMRGKHFFWVSLAFCVANLIFPELLREGVVAPFGGFFTGLLLAGSPSPLRRAYLKTKLFFLRRKKSSLRVEDILSPPLRPQKRPRPSNAPPLRVVQGGLDEVLKNRKVPKDKRYLN
jgi:membrane associated rhomboid family serine protease